MIKRWIMQKEKARPMRPDRKPKKPFCWNIWFLHALIVSSTKYKKSKILKPRIVHILQRENISVHESKISQKNQEQKEGKKTFQQNNAPSFAVFSWLSMTTSRSHLDVYLTAWDCIRCPAHSLVSSWPPEELRLPCRIPSTRPELPACVWLGRWRTSRCPTRAPPPLPNYESTHMSEKKRLT